MGHAVCEMLCGLCSVGKCCVGHAIQKVVLYLLKDGVKGLFAHIFGGRVW